MFFNGNKPIRMVSAFKSGLFANALRLAEKLLRQTPAFPNAHRIRVLSLSRMQRHDEALAACREAIALFPESPEPYAVGVSVAIAARDFKTCLEMLLEQIRRCGNINCGQLHNVLKNAAVQFARSSPSPAEMRNHLEGLVRTLREICDHTGRRLLLMIGNCQLPVITEILNNTPAFTAQCFAYCYKGVHVCSPTELDSLANALELCDGLISQYLYSAEFGRLRTEELRAACRGSLVTIPTCWFNVTSLDAFRLSQMRAGDPDANMHSVLLARAFLGGLNLDQAVEYYEEAELFSGGVLTGSLKATEENLRQRDAHLDFSVTDFVLEGFRDRRLFHSYNHPTLEVLLEICAGISERLDLPFTKDPAAYAAFDRLTNPLWNIHPKIRSHFNLRFHEESRFAFGGQRLSPAAFAQREYKLFAGVDREVLAADVARKEQELKIFYA